MSSPAVLGTVMLGLSINGVYCVQHDINPMPTFIAGGFFTGALLFIDEYVDSGLAFALAAIYLLTSFLYHGQAFINAATNISSPKAPAKTTRKAV